MRTTTALSLEVVLRSFSRMDRPRTMAARRRSAAPDEPSTGTRRVLRQTDAAPLVLLVDDVQDARDMYAQYFAEQGLRVVQAVDGDHALWKVITLLPDVVVMDLSMPVLDGWEATHHIKSHARTKHIAVIVLTGLVTRAELRRAEDAGADLVLTKPCPPDALLIAVRSVLRR
jgi:two-component system, cell cycle response regulator DivK